MGRKIATPQSLLHGPGVPSHCVKAVLLVPGVRIRQFVLLRLLPHLPGARLGFKPQCLKESCSVCPSSGEVLLCAADIWPLAGGAGSLCTLNGYIPSSYSTPRRGLLSPTADHASGLVTEPRAGSLPPQVWEQGSQSQSRDSLPVRDWVYLQFPSVVFLLSRYSATLANLSFSSLCLSAEGHPSPLFLRRPFYVSHFAVTQPWPVMLSQWVPGGVPLTLLPRLLEFKVLWSQHRYV